MSVKTCISLVYQLAVKALFFAGEAFLPQPVIRIWIVPVVGRAQRYGA